MALLILWNAFLYAAKRNEFYSILHLLASTLNGRHSWEERFLMMGKWFEGIFIDSKKEFFISDCCVVDVLKMMNECSQYFEWILFLFFLLLQNS